MFYLFLIKSKNLWFVLKNWKMISIAKFQSRIINNNIFKIIKFKCSFWLPFCIIIFVKIDKNLQIYIYNIILPFYSTIN